MDYTYKIAFHAVRVSLQLCNLYENDCIFDKFECAVSGDANNVLTGSYSNMCHMYDRYGQSMASLEVSEVPLQRRVVDWL